MILIYPEDNHYKRSFNAVNDFLLPRLKSYDDNERK